MSGTVVEEPETDQEEPEVRTGPDLSKLEDHTPMWARTSRPVAGLVLVVGLVYLLFSLRPIWHTDIWGHLSYGRWIVSHRSLPATEPLMPLAVGMRFVDTAWLSQVIGFLIAGLGDASGLQGLYGLSVTLCTGLLAFRTYQVTRNGWFSFASVMTFLAVAWAPLMIIRPQLAGLACFVILLTRLTHPRPRRSDWVVVPLLFAAWANLHASFLTGLLLLACFAFGRAIDLFRRSGSLQMAFCDHRVRRSLLLLQLAAVAVLLNPYGVLIYTTTFQISSNPNLSELTEWFPLNIREGQGQVFALAAVALAALYRSSPRRVRSWEVLSLLALGASALWSSRMTVWWAPVAAYLIAIHGHAVWRSWRRLPLVPQPAPRAGKWTVVAVGLVWICFAISPLGNRIIHGKAPAIRAFSPETPTAAVQYLKKNPPKGQIFNTYEWGDFLLWAGPPGIKVFVNSHAHLVPRDVWLAYLQVIELRGGWEDTLDKYGVNTIVVDHEFREPLIKKLKDNEKWKLVFEQDGQSIFERKTPI